MYQKNKALYIRGERDMENRASNISKLSRDDIDKFYSAKYDSYKQLSINIIINMIINSLLFLVIDCVIEDRFVVENIIPRCLMLIFIVPYIYLTKRHNYKTNIAISYLIIYGIGACNIWAVSNVNNTSYISDTFLLMQISFLAFGLAVPKSWSQLGHIGILIELALAAVVIPNMNLLLVLIIQLMTYTCIEYILSIIEDNFLDNYSSSEVIESKVVKDQLTSAFNRYKIQDLCIGSTNELEIKRASILLIDIDFFKKINDTYGHETGDVVLQNLVEIIREFVRRTDYIIRWGGEEFIIILPDCGEVKAKQIAETLRENVIRAGENMCNATISIGIANYIGGDYHDTIKKADEALYYAKEHGRNQVVLSNDLK